MIQKHRSLQIFEDSLRSMITAYTDGECELEDIIHAADKVACYKANVGINPSRLKHNEREQAFHDQWQQENAPVAGINNGHGILQDLFINRGEGFGRTVVEEINNRDRMIVATVIQWLGSNCGMCFLNEALARFNCRVAENKEK